MEETLATMATEAAEVATEATVPLMEQIAPLYDAVVLSCSLVLLCGGGLNDRPP